MVRYTAYIPEESFDMRLRILGIALDMAETAYTLIPSRDKYNPHIVINMDKENDAIEYELRKMERRDGGYFEKEILRG